MKMEKFSQTHRREIMAILQRKLNINPKVKLIDIFPDHHDFKLFFANSFSLNSKVSAHAVEAGYTDPDNDGILGSSPIEVDGSGRVINQGGYSGGPTRGSAGYR